MTQILSTDQQANHDDLIARARELVPLLRQRTKEMDQLRHLPEATVKELLDARLFQLTTPRVYGGHQVEMRTYMDVVAELGRGDASTAWTVSIINVCNWLVAVLFPEEVQREVFRTEGGARCCGVLQPRKCEVKRVEGGYLIEEGMWGFNSGAYHANWDVLGMPLVNEQGEVIDQGTFLIPRQEVALLDDWYTIGMQGTGSTTIVVKKTFIPDRHVASTTRLAFGGDVSEHERKEEQYRWASAPVLVIVLAFPLLGAARAMLELFLERLPNRGIQYTWYTKQAEATLTHLQVAEAASKIDAASLLLERAAADIDAWGQRSDPMEYMNRARIRMDSGYAARLLYEAVDLLGAAAGGSFAGANNPLNHIWRDVRAGSLHGFLNPTTNQELYGRLLCGQPANTILV